MKNLKSTLLLLVMCLVVGCSSDPTGGTLGSESHWLGSCEVTSECGEGLSCLCGVCTMACERDDACLAQDADASCVPVDALARDCAAPPVTVCWSDAAGPWTLAEPDMTPDSDMTGPPEVLATHFVTTWDTSKAVGGDSDRVVEIGIGEGTFNYDVDWDNDGVFDQMGLTAGVTHTYGAPGAYTVRVRGAFPHFQCDANTGNKNCSKLISVDQWGDIEWGSMSRSFEGAANLETLPTDTPNLSQVESLFRMFSLAPKVDGALGGWDTSTITDMSFMFNSAERFNQPIGGWDTGQVTTMLGLFHNAASFDQPLGGWDTSKVTDMSYMFFEAGRFNQPVGAWDTGQVTTTIAMFQDAVRFDQPLEGWDTGRVRFMSHMFQGAQAFNRSLDAWNVSVVEYTTSMFEGAQAFDQPLGGWNTSSLSVMSSMFRDAKQFNQPIGRWDTSRVVDARNMFWGAERFNQPLGGWDTSNLEYARLMFKDATSFNQPLGGWDMRAARDINEMFMNAASFDQELSQWHLFNINSATGVFDGSGLSRESYDATLEGWSVRDYNPVASIVRLGAQGLTYCRSEGARRKLEEERNWLFSGDTRSCD